jgi:hypothetical protein
MVYGPGKNYVQYITFSVIFILPWDYLNDD